jgi:hypothetical protein
MASTAFFITAGISADRREVAPLLAELAIRTPSAENTRSGSLGR